MTYNFSIDLENQTVHITREFKATLELVWDAWTKAEILDKWWAPKPFASVTKVMNFKVGDRRFYAMVGTEGFERWAIQKYTSITPKTNFKFTSVFADKDENPDMYGSDWDLSFTEQNGCTTLSISIRNESRERMEKMLEMGFKEGFEFCLQQLDELLALGK